MKRYIVSLSVEEREQLNKLIQKGKGSARQLLKARILLKADASDAGEGWSDSQIAAVLETSADTFCGPSRLLRSHSTALDARRTALAACQVSCSLTA